MIKKVYLRENEFIRISYITLGLKLNKPYEVIEEVIRKINKENKYKIEDDYGNIIWINSIWFFEIEEVRDDKINDILR